MKFVVLLVLTCLASYSQAGLLTFVRRIFRRSKSSLVSHIDGAVGTSALSGHAETSTMDELESRNNELREEVIHLRHLTLRQKKQIQTLKAEKAKSQRKLDETEASHKTELKELAAKLEADFESRKQKYLKSVKSEFENKFKDQIKELKASHEMELEEIKKELANASESSEAKYQKEIAKLESKLSKKQEKIDELVKLQDKSEKHTGLQKEEIESLKSKLRQLSVATQSSPNTAQKPAVSSSPPSPSSTVATSDTKSAITPVKPDETDDESEDDSNDEKEITEEPQDIPETSGSGNKRSSRGGRRRGSKIQRGSIKPMGKKASSSKSRK